MNIKEKESIRIIERENLQKLLKELQTGDKLENIREEESIAEQRKKIDIERN